MMLSMVHILLPSNFVLTTIKSPTFGIISHRFYENTKPFWIKKAIVASFLSFLDVQVILWEKRFQGASFLRSVLG
jgi:hypothetical protein